MAKLGDVCSNQSSNIKQSDLENNHGQYPIYGASGFIKNVDFFIQDRPYIGIVKDGAGVGRVMLLPAFSSIIGTMQYIIPNKGVDVRFLAYAMEFMNLSKFSTGATIPHIYFKDYKHEYLKIYDYETQKQIATALDSVTRVIALCNAILEKLDLLVKSQFVEMFGDPKLNPHGYPVHQLSDHIQFLTSGSRGWAQYCVDEGTEWFITIKNVKDCHISTVDMQAINAPDNAEAKRTRVQEGDLLISITADLGRTGVVTQEIAEHGAYINQHLTCIRLDRKVLEPLYVAYFMESAAGKEQFITKNQSAVKAGLNFNSINTLQLLVPPIEIQQQFLHFVFQIDKSKFIVKQALAKAQLLFDSLMQQYFG